MNLLYQFSTFDSPVHRLNARSKFVIAVSCIVLTFFLGTTVEWALFFAFLLGYGLVARITPWDYRVVFAVLIPFGIAITLIQVLTHPGGPVMFYIGGWAISQTGLYLGLTVFLRTLGLAVASVLFAMTTHPSEMTAELTTAGLPFRYAYMTSVALHFLPLLADELKRIMDAQQSRAADISRYGSLSRAAALPKLILPLAVGTVRRSEDIAVAMEMRGLSTASRYGRTQLDFRPARSVDRVVVALVPTLLAIMILVRLFW